MSLLDDWIVHCADPVGRRATAPRQPLAPELGDRLIEQAEAHGVLGRTNNSGIRGAPFTPHLAVGPRP